ncbi:PilZ domain-containing protein [Cognatilysobacter lacus]|uniref:PilZ domain-containing protein n=1 Tax=Cognatilysobacter lacus TaxID=1643323 RepID=A0A5D8ZCA7_9GAMM|nr:PilZ domain-containing protein [Lysobacter lacus]TZF90304.1 PilZ domain-containing protein [Lysobacter lacus]
MNTSVDESRRSRRRRVDERVDVIDSMTDQAIGQLGNISDSGLLLLAGQPLHEDCLYQLRFTLADRSGLRFPLEIGAHLLWQNAAAAPGQAWMGFRFLSLEDGQLDRLREWIDAPGATYV